MSLPRRFRAAVAILLAVPLLPARMCPCGEKEGDAPAEELRIPEGELRGRRARVLEALGRSAPPGDLLLLRADPARRTGGGIEGDPDPPRSPDLLYLSGIEEDGAALLLLARELEGLGREMLFLPPPKPGEGIWIARSLTRSEASARSGIPEKSILPAADLGKVLEKAIPLAPARDGGPVEPRPRIYLDLGGNSPGRDRAASGSDFLAGQLGIEAIQLEVLSPRILTAPLRQVKSPGEVRLLRRAVQITCGGLREALRAARPGAAEHEIAALLEYEYRRRGARGSSFSPIVGAGPNSCLLHYDLRPRLRIRRIEAGDLVLLDTGADVGGYGADITRTAPASGRFSERQRRVYDIVLEAQDAALRSVRPGATIDLVHRSGLEKIEAGLRDLGLLRGSAGVRKFLPHFTVHSLGLDVHDAMSSRRLEPGMVITCEPGIYIAEESLGIRIEDDVLVTEDGCEVLSAGLPRSADEIERWINPRSF